MTDDRTADDFVDEGRPIQTVRLVLRALKIEDASAIARLANDRRIAEMTVRIPHPYDFADAERFIAGRPASELARAITRSDDGTLVGIAGFAPVREGRAVDLGYWLGVEHWGRGYGTETAQALVDFAFSELAIECILGSCRVVNSASRRILEKCGFQYRGTGMLESVVAGRVAAECFQLDRGAWRALKAWGSR